MTAPVIGLVIGLVIGPVIGPVIGLVIGLVRHRGRVRCHGLMCALADRVLGIGRLWAVIVRCRRRR